MSLPIYPLAAVVFDFGGVVQRGAQSAREALVAQHLHLDLVAVKAELKSAEQAVKRGLVSERDFWRDFAARLGGRVDDDAAFANALAAHYLAPGINGEVLALARRLAGQGLITPLCSNTMPSRAALNERRGAYAPFWPRLLSCEVGALKPSGAMFAALLQQTQLLPEQHLFVDDKQANVAAAEAAGMWGHAYTQLAPMQQALRAHGVAI